MKKISVWIAVGLLFCLCSCKQNTLKKVDETDYVSKVDMFMGVQGNSHSVIGPQLPHGSISPSPHTPKGADGGYLPDQPILGFGQLHVTGTGWGRYGQVLLSPQTGSFSARQDGHDSPKSNETASPCYYGVTLDRYNTRVEIAPEHHSAFYRFTYPSDSTSFLLLDLTHSVSQHIVPWTGGHFYGGEIHYDENTATFNGWGLYNGGWGSQKPYKVCFAMKMDITPENVSIIDAGTDSLYAKIDLPAGTAVLNVQVAVSLKSADKAMQYLVKEMNNKSFEDIRDAAHDIWNQTLGKIEVQGGTPDEQKLFYTCLYHSFLMPRDRSGDAPYREGEAAHVDDHLCAWDTWRTKYPLMVLVDEPFVAKTINSFIDRLACNHQLNPTFTSSLDGTWKQGGDDTDNIIADAMVKGVKGFDYKKAYEVGKWQAFHARDIVQGGEYLKQGWQPKKEGGTKECSATMEYAYNDFCVSEMATIAGDDSTAKYLKNRASQWINLFNPDLSSGGFKGFIAPKKENGEWWLPLDSIRFFREWDHVYFYEGNAWIYTLFVPHELDKMIACCGGKETMCKRLQYSFDNKLVSLSNEPCFLAPFVFSHCDRPDLAARYVAQIRQSDFSLSQGFPDNEDSGAMGSWYVFTSIGLFPNAGQDFYYLLPPAFSRVNLHLSNGKTLIMKIEGNLAGNRNNPKSITLNGIPLTANTLKHSQIRDGGELIFKY
ncbi:MAG: GH92 family glycosyl hydrolase [Bacteroidales bacterium]|nr:GH92 family glycosyl hydrolase [Bacteroidales bacterium]